MQVSPDGIVRFRVDIFPGPAYMGNDGGKVVSYGVVQIGGAIGPMCIDVCSFLGLGLGHRGGFASGVGPGSRAFLLSDIYGWWFRELFRGCV